MAYEISSRNITGLVFHPPNPNQHGVNWSLAPIIFFKKISVVLPSGENFTTHSSGIRELQNNMLRNSDTWEKSMIKCQLFFTIRKNDFSQPGKTNGGNPFHRKESISFLHCELGLWHLATNLCKWLSESPNIFTPFFDVENLWHLWVLKTNRAPTDFWHIRLFGKKFSFCLKQKTHEIKPHPPTLTVGDHQHPTNQRTVQRVHVFTHRAP